MRLNSNKNLLLFFCLFKLILNADPYTLSPKGTVHISGNGEQQYEVNFSSGSLLFDNYISLKFTVKDSGKRNPAIIISQDSDAKDRLFTSVQLYDDIYIFLLKHQITKGKIFIKVQNREKSEVADYNIIVSNTDRAYLPFNKQTSYYVPESQANSTMQFVFQKDNSESTDITFWAQGKSIQRAEMDGFTKRTFSSTYISHIFYGSILNGGDNYNLVVESVKGDYITVGSTTLKGKIAPNGLKENRNEMIVATQRNEVCFSIPYEAKIMHITGEIYTFKAKGTFKNSIGEPIEINDEKIETQFKNGILSDFNAIGILDNSFKTGYYCLDEPGLKIFSIQMTCNVETQLVTAPMLPGDIRRHFLERGQIAIFYGTKPRMNTKEVNFNLKSLKGFPEMYYTECPTFPECHYTTDDLETSDDIEKLYPSNRFSTYSFYMKDETNKDFSPISEVQPIMIVYCAEGGEQDIFGESAFCTFETSIFTSDDHVLLP